MSIPLQQIALRISGTKQRQAGFAPLVVVGVLPAGEGDNMDRSTIIIDKPVYVIKHAPEYILYQVIDRKVKSFDADASGVLSIALTIPRAYQLAECKSPYTLLKEVYDRFVKDYMVPLNDGRDSFLNVDANGDVFKEIIAKYPLEERKTAYVPMARDGLTGTLCIPQEKMEAFLRDTQYEQFAFFKYIEIGRDCMTSPGLDHLEIPRPVKYEVFVNDQPRQVIMSKPTDAYKAIEPDTPFHTFEPIEFTLDELLKSPEHRIANGKNVVELNIPQSRIFCKLGKTDILYHCEVRVTGSPDDVEGLQKKMQEGFIPIKVGDRDLSDFPSDGSGWKIPALNVSQGFKCVPNCLPGKNVTLVSAPDRNERKVLLTMTVSRPKVATVPVGQKIGGPSQNDEKYKDLEEKFETRGVELKKAFGTIDRQKNIIKILGLALVLLFLAAVATGSFALNQTKKLEKEKVKVMALDSLKKTLDAAKLELAANRKMQEEAETARIQEEERLRMEQEEEERKNAEKAEKEKQKAAQAAQADAERNKARAEILALVNNKEMANDRKLAECRKHAGWGTALSTKEKYAIEAFLADVDKKYKNDKGQWTNLAKLKQNVQNYQKAHASFASLEQMVEENQGIIDIENEYKKQK